MRFRLLTVLLASAALLACQSTAPTKQAQDEAPIFNYAKADQQLIDTLAELGSNIVEEHQLSFIVMCEKKSEVAKVLAGGVKYKFSVDDIHFDQDKKYWRSTMTKPLYLEVELIQKQRAPLLPYLNNTSCLPLTWSAQVVM
ncbi:ribonuclease E inhibitor RraB [Thalassotalea agarivorans]|uniref:Regulator of ribonuclease activity B n=1 Tax=Thalassotalea agarivorans TaxID=349064 RepID=A0A1I0CSY3_THASX|nr:ribonuclease E inhibitor RraB [Thalassotalea agarivorans]SET22825.1 Regulator of ribonuclease activity B [Thalassotalea agarivorans]